MSSSSLGGRTSTGWGVAIESCRPVPQITGNASARPFRGELILRWYPCWTPSVELWTGAFPAHLPSFRQACHEAYIRLQMFFQTKVFLTLQQKRHQSWYKFALSAVSSRSESPNDFLSLPDWPVVVFGSRSVEESRDGAERRDGNEPGSPCVNWLSE